MAFHFEIPGITRRRRKEKVPEVAEFVPIRKVFKHQSEVTMLKSVTGHVNNDKTLGKKWHFDANKVYFIDYDVADSWIIKGYASGELSRNYSSDEVAHIRASVTNISGGIGGING